MNDNPVQFGLEICFEGLSIFANAIDTNIDFTLNLGFGWIIIESDDVGKGFMLQKLDVYISQVVIGAKNIIERNKRSTLPFNGFFNP